MINERLRQIAYEIIKEINQYSLWEKFFNRETRKEVKNMKLVLKLITNINDKLMKTFEKQTEKSLYMVKIHPAQRKKIKTICEKQAEQTSYLLFKHFDKDNKGYVDLDTLMQAIFYPHKMQANNFSDFIFQIGDYTMKHREYLSGLGLEDIKNGDIHWDVLKIDPKVVKIMKAARQKEEPVYPQSPLDENDMQVIESLETILPEQRRPKVQKAKPHVINEKYKPINAP